MRPLSSRLIISLYMTTRRFMQAVSPQVGPPNLSHLTQVSDQRFRDTTHLQGFFLIRLGLPSLCFAGGLPSSSESREGFNLLREDEREGSAAPCAAC